MSEDPLLERKDQLGEEEREHLEDAVTEMCECIEDYVELQFTQKSLDDHPTDSMEKGTHPLVVDL
jgi:hypothetical protein